MDGTEVEASVESAKPASETGQITLLNTRHEVDITDEFFQRVKELDSGEIAMHSHYSLCDAVSAIEIMDPKMDSGMIRPDPTLGLQNALKNGKLKQKLPVTELLATVDCTFAAIASWLYDAQSPDQTVFTNIWLHDLNTVTDPVHNALAKSAFFFVQVTRAIVNMAACYSEEDFIVSHSFEFRQRPFKFNEIIEALETADELVVARIKSKQNKQENAAILNRIRFYQQIFIAFDALVPVNEKQQTAASDKKWQPQLMTGKLALKMALIQMHNARESIKLGRQPPDGNDGNYSWLACFQPKVNQHLLPPTFPREIRFMSRVDGYNYMINVFQATFNMVNEAPEARNVISLDPLMDYLERYSYAGIVTRSVNQLMLLPVDDCLLGARPMADLVTSSISEFAPSVKHENLQEYIASVSFDLTADYEEFMMDSVRAFLNIIQLFGHNRTRFHDKYLPELIDIFALLRAKAISLETNIREVLVSTDVRHCFSTFSDFYATRLALLHMDMSFQLELYVDYELPYVFWCYTDVLYHRMVGYCKTRSQLLAYEMNFQRLNSIEFLKAQSRERHARSSLNKMLVYEDLVTGCFLMFSALADSGKVQMPPHEENRFWRRMFVCAQIFAEEELSYDRYWNYFLYARENDSPPLKMKDWSVESRFAAAIDYFKQAEATMTRHYVVNEPLLKAIKSNLIAVKMLLNKLDTGKKIRVEYAQGPLYPTVSIK